MRDERVQAYRAQVPFKFTIPDQLISLRSDVHPDFLRLCPSTNVGRNFGNALCFVHAQPWINYHIKISRVCAGDLIPSVVSSRAREIPIVPFSYAEPPIEPDHHPHQYKCATTKALKKTIFGRPLAKLTISAMEPAPINLFTESPRASGVVSLKLTLSAAANQSHVELSRWRLVVKSRLRTRTFTTIRRLPRAPTSMTSQTDPFLHMVERKEKWEVRDYGPVSWRSVERGGDQEDSKPLWTAEIRVPVNVSKALLPTFLNLLSARQYTVVLRVSISELPGCKGLELAIPVQLIYHDQDKPMGEHPNFAFRCQDDGEWWETRPPSVPRVR